MRKAARAVITLVVAVLLVAGAAGCSSGSSSTPTLTMGAEASPAMTVLARIYAIVLRNNGAQVSPTTVTGSYPQLLGDMDAARVDLFAARSGTLLAELAPQDTAVSADDVFVDLNRSLPQGVSSGDSTTVDAAPEVFVASATARSAGVTDLASCGRLPAGLPLVVAVAPDTARVATFTAAGCRFGPTEVVGSPAAVLARVARGDAIGILNPLDVVGQSTSVQALAVPGTPGPGTPGPGVNNPRSDLLVPVYRTAALTGDQVKAINRVAGELTTADLATMAATLTAHTSTADDVAARWLAEHGM